MCFITQIKMFLILFLKNKVQRYPKVLGFFSQLLLIIIKSFVVDILVQILPRFFSTKSSIISFLMKPKGSQGFSPEPLQSIKV